MNGGPARLSGTAAPRTLAVEKTDSEYGGADGEIEPEHIALHGPEHDDGRAGQGEQGEHEPVEHAADFAFAVQGDHADEMCIRDRFSSSYLSLY